MLMIIRTKATPEILKNLAEDLDGYIKFVVDIERKILAAGGMRHVEGEKLLIDDGSQQANLWGGGLDLPTGEIDFDSMINLRPNQNNPSREVLVPAVREKVAEIAKELLS